jgi:hypothetical protein
VAEADAVRGEREASGEKSVDGIVDGVRSIQHQRFNSVGGEHVGGVLADAAAHHGIGPSQHFDKPGVISAGIGEPAAKRTGDDSAILNFKNQEGRAARQMVANGDAIDRRNGDSGWSHEILR